MHLRALKLHGFKSFADQTTLNFQPGVTAIVGPNGCGKSNIADSIRWVLGEQSAKALRGGKMQDVIFEGADTRKPSQICEVSLLLTECEKALGSEFHEIEITRRVHRDGQSEYFFNGQPCRLKDIHKLFMDTGIGRTSYSIMAQGQIDQILSSKPEERRVVFEEAAGITKYKAQRREAMNKLALTEQNLARVSDVINEVARQIGSLRRQAAKAMRYKRLSFRLRHLALAHGNYHWRQLSTALADLEGRVSGLRGEADTRRETLDERTRALDERKAHRSALMQRVQDAQQAVFDLRSQREQADNAANMAHVKRQGLAERLASANDDLGELEMQIRELASQVDTGAQDKQTQLSLLGSSDAVFQERNRELAVLEGELTRIEQALGQDKFHLLQLESAVARHITESSSLEVDARTSQHRYDQVAADIEEVRQSVAAAAQALNDARQRVEEARVEQSRQNNEAQAAQVALQDATKNFREGQRRLQEIDRNLAQKTARLKLLQQLHEKWEGFGEGAKAILQGRFASILGEQKLVPITQGLEVRAEFAKAVEALLGSSVEAISVADVDTAKKILAQLETDQIGSVCLQVSAFSGQQSAVSELPAGLKPATEAVANLEPSHPAAALLSACYVADDLAAFLEFWKANPAFSFLMVATPRGDLVDRRGLIYGGHHKKPANSIVQREVDLRETGKAVVAEQAAHDEQKALIEQINAALVTAEQTLEQKRKDVLAASQQAATLHSEEKNAQRAHDEAANRLGRMQNELGNLQRDNQEALARHAKAQAQLAEAQAEVEAQKQKIAQTEAEISGKRADRDQKKESLSQARLELAERRQKVEVLDRGLSEMERRRAQLADLHDERQIEIESWTEQISQLESESAGQRARAEEIATTLAVAQQNVESVRNELTSIESEINSVEAGMSSIRTEAEASMSELSRTEVKVAENRARLQFLIDEVTHEFQTDVSTLDWKHLLWHADDEPEGMKDLDLDEEDEGSGQQSAVSNQPAALPAAAPAEPAVAGEAVAVVPNGPEGAAPAAAAEPAKPRRKKKKEKGEPTEADFEAMEKTDWTAIKTEVDALRQRLGSMGAVNLVAIEEYSELKQRYEFLKTQVDDLTNAKAALLKAIDDINHTSLEQFKVTFEQIRKNFAYTFNILFGGGRAEIELVTAEDPLESGIEIVAQPPGTKLKGITLLSGGQKTLTAVALLFALYMVKPSPFCLLDELDAPLDESNIHRFTNLLKRFVDSSQFIIITHNKSTIAAADAIYGVTMQERGVSRTLSMKFDKVSGEAEALPTTVADAVRNARPKPVEA